ncbi:MAG: L-serine ammonia-lyase [Gammaproteobacteria bacterium]|nr:L-serine ammonia-lyase [Gammaproteobacteria bacterium]
MHISVFDLFAIGIGPSSSHTVGPMKAAQEFAHLLGTLNLLSCTEKVNCDLYGSLALTGKGHGTDAAVLMGLQGEHPKTIDPETIPESIHHINLSSSLNLSKKKKIAFSYSENLIFHYNETLPHHTNGMRFTAFNQAGQPLLEKIYYSIGGGFILSTEDLNKEDDQHEVVPFPFETAHELMQHCQENLLTIAGVMMANEKMWRSEEEVKNMLLDIADTMLHCIQKGCDTEGILPGGLYVKRRAPSLYKKLLNKGKPSATHPDIMNWLNVFAMAVNEQNAAGGKIVTAPTNGAAGIIPAVLNYYKTFCEYATPEGVINFLLTAGAIAILYKKGASISGAEVGCQGEVGVACSMAAGALAAALGGSVRQIEKAAEIGMEHNLGLTCDPIGGLVQIPCIERNAMGAVKAVNAARLVLAEDEGEESDGEHIITLDNVIKTMRQIGKDMMPIYKETSLGGLAKHGGVTVNVTEC